MANGLNNRPKLTPKEKRVLIRERERRENIIKNNMEAINNKKVPNKRRGVAVLPISTRIYRMFLSLSQSERDNLLILLEKNKNTH